MECSVDGDRHGQACLQTAEATTTFDRQAAMNEILAILSSDGREMTGEELVDRCQCVGLVPHDGRAFGPVFKELSRRGLIETVGFALRRKGRGTAGARVWRTTAASR